MMSADHSPRRRARAFGIGLGELRPGPLNAITDVPGVAVGSVTIERGSGDAAIRTGATVIVPHPGDVYADKVPAALHTINGYGKPTGLAQLAELGTLETPIALTNTFNVGEAFSALVRHAVETSPFLAGPPPNSVNAVVAECNDSKLSASETLPVTVADVRRAIDEATGGPVEEGAVGAGTGMTCFGVKGGIGTASRVVEVGGRDHVLGALVLSNFGRPRALRINGRLVGPELVRRMGATPAVEEDRGSIVVVLATDVALDARQLGRLARRVQNGIARVGGLCEHGSGEFGLAFSVPGGATVADGSGDPAANAAINLLFQAVAEATEEAILNSMFMASAVTGVRGHHVPALPVDAVAEILCS